MSFQSEICGFGQFALFRQNHERISSTIKFGVGDRRPTADPLTESPYTKMVLNLTKSENRAKVTLPLIPDFYQKSLRAKIRLKILELNSRKKHFDPHSSNSVLGEKTSRI
jgi:hypothetical protein